MSGGIRLERARGLIRDLAGAAGEEHVLTDPGLVGGYVTDWTRRYHGDALCVVRPGSTAQVAAVLRACAAHGATVVPQGGNTGLVGGSIPAEGAVLLSTTRLRELGPVDTLAAQVTAGAGVTIGRLRAHAAAAGLAYGVDLASRDSATVGGTIATNAGGIHTIRYGPTRSQILGVEAVLADGSVISRLSGLQADNAGYDLTQLLAGSEGTLAVITAARLRLWPAEPDAVAVLAGVSDIAAAASLYAQVRARRSGLRAAEYFEAAGLDLVRKLTGLPLPLHRPAPAYLLTEFAGSDDHDERLAAIPALEASAVAMDAASRAALWAYRERHTEAIAAAGIPHKMDVAVPLARLAAFRAGLDDAVLSASSGVASSRVASSGVASSAVGGGATVASSGVASSAVGPATVVVFGHIGAGNLHVNVLGPDPADNAVDEAVMRLAAAHGGTISAEHGIGRAKAALLPLSRSAAEIAAMRAVKAALDPRGLLNPGVLL